MESVYCSMSQMCCSWYNVGLPIPTGFCQRGFAFGLLQENSKIRFLYFVLVFDLEDEVLREIPLPKHSDMFYWKWVSIFAYGNSIAVIEPGYVLHTLDIWVLKNYADASSRTKIISLDAQAPPQDIPRPPSWFLQKENTLCKSF